MAHRIQVYDYPGFSEDVNSRLFNFIESNNTEIMGGSLMTDLFLHKKENVDLLNLFSWINSILPEVSHNFGRVSDVPFNLNDYYNPSELHAGGKYAFNPLSFKVKRSWGLLYGSESFVERHNHFPYTIAFVYYVNVPKGCSSVIIEDQSLDINPGQIVIFQGHINHCIPPSNVDGRCVIAGLIHYEDEY